MSKICLF